MTTTETTTRVPAGTWQLDPVHSSVGFAVGYVAGTFRGTFDAVEARLEGDGSTARVEGTAQVKSVQVKDENLEAHLQSPDFFDAERFPELRFGGEIVPVGDEVEVRGEITIKGTTRPLVARGTAAGPMTDAFGNERVSLTLSATVDRTDFDITWNMPLPTGQPALQHDVTISADLLFTQAS